MIAKLAISLILFTGGYQPPVSAPHTALCPQYWQTAVGQGFNIMQLEKLDAIMWRESRCLTMSFNPKDPMGGSRGLMQINGFWTDWLRSRGILSHAEDLFKPEVNLRASLAIHNYSHAKNKNGWHPWRM